MTAARRRAALVLLAIRGAGAKDPDARAKLERVVALVDAMEHDVPLFSEFDAACRFLVAHELVIVEGGEILSLTAMGFAATAGTPEAAYVDEALELVGSRLASLGDDDAPAGASSAVIDERAYERAVREHVVARPSRPTATAKATAARPTMDVLPPPPDADDAGATSPTSTPASSPPSRTATAAKVAGILAAGTALGVAGLPSAAVVLATAGIGSVVAMGDVSARRVAGATARIEPHELDAYRVTVPAERYAVGHWFQFRLLPATNRAWAPGLLCIADDHVRFVASDEARAGRDWEGPCDRLEVRHVGLGNRVSTVLRVHHPDGEPHAQFVVQGRFEP